MTTDTNKLLERLRTYYGDDLACRMLLMDARHALEAMAEQRDRFVERFNEARLALQAAEAERDRLKGEVERLKSQRDEYLQFWKNNAEACEAAEAERDRLSSEVERAKVKATSMQRWIDHHNERADKAESERDRMKAALENFIAEANTAPKRIIGNGIGGQTMEATLKASGRLISEWQIERLRNSMELHVEGCREEL